MKSSAKLLSLLLSAALLLPMTACSNNSASGDDASADASAEAVTAEPAAEDAAGIAEDHSIYEDLPSGDYGGREFSILIPTHTEKEFLGDLTGDGIDEAVYKRNLAAEDELKIKVNPISEPGLWDQKDTFISKVTNSVLTADDAFQLVSGYAAYITSVVSSAGILANWNEVPDVNFEKPWWNHDVVKEMNVNGRLFYVTGELSMTSLEYLFSMFFNKDLMKDFGLDMPYDAVREGRWTLDLLSLYVSVGQIDVNGDGKMDVNDLYGYTSDKTNFVSAFQASFDADITVSDENGIPTLAIQEETFTDKFLSVYSFLCENPAVYLAAEEGSYTDDMNREATKIFAEGRALFEGELLGNAAALRNIEIDFGILPYPKHTEEQEAYHTTAWDAYNLFCIPATAELSFVGTVTEYMAAKSFEYVLPAFYDKALLTKYARDTESTDMISIIREGATYNFGQVNSIHCGSCGHIFRDLVGSGSNNISSKVGSGAKAMQKSLERFLEGAYLYD